MRKVAMDWAETRHDIPPMRIFGDDEEINGSDSLTRGLYCSV